MTFAGGLRKFVLVRSVVGCLAVRTTGLPAALLLVSCILKKRPSHSFFRKCKQRLRELKGCTTENVMKNSCIHMKY